MKKAEIKAVLDRVLTWPPERQEEAARVLTEMEEQLGSDLQLGDDQVAEVERRLTEAEPRFLSLEEVRARFVHRRG
jgi:hypothetical protein